MTSPELPLFLSTDKIHALTYYYSLKGAIADACSPSPSECFVSDIFLYKNTHNPFHEFLVARACFLDHPVYLRIERTCPRRTDSDYLSNDSYPLPEGLQTAFTEAYRNAENDQTQANVPCHADGTIDDSEELEPSLTVNDSDWNAKRLASHAWGMFSPFFSTSVSGASSQWKGMVKGRPAGDFISMVDSLPGSNGNARLLKHVRFSQNILLLPRLALLAQIVHTKDPLYTLLHRQCYWYVNLILLVLEMDAISNVPGDDAEDPRGWVRWTRSTYLLVPVGHIQKELVMEMRKQFEIGWKDFVTVKETHEELVQMKKALVEHEQKAGQDQMALAQLGKGKVEQVEQVEQDQNLKALAQLREDMAEQDQMALAQLKEDIVKTALVQVREDIAEQRRQAGQAALVQAQQYHGIDHRLEQLQVEVSSRDHWHCCQLQ